MGTVVHASDTCMHLVLIRLAVLAERKIVATSMNIHVVN